MTKVRRQSLCLVLTFLTLIGLVAPSQIVLDLREGNRPEIVDLFQRMPTRTNLRRLEGGLESRCRPAQRIRPWAQFAHFILLHDTGDKALRGRSGWFFYKPAVRYLVEPWSPGDTGAQGNIFDAIISFRDDLSKRGIRLLVVIAPNKASIYPEMLATRAGAAGAPVNPVTRAVLTKLDQAGIEVVDLFEVYRQARESPDNPACYLAQDSHWSPEGMRLAAQAVARRLLDSGWVREGPIEYELKPRIVERHGDILRMIRTPQIERLYRPERLHCAQVLEARTAKPYADDPDSPVLVLGDSFLRIYERDEPGSAGFVSHLAHQLGFGLASIINDGGASTLVRQHLARKPELLKGKKVVIWEFVERDIRFGTEGWQVIPLPRE